MGEIKYDKLGRMQYNPAFHFNHQKRFTTGELEYLCKFYEADGAKTISLALGKTEMTIQSKINTLKKKGLYKHYKNMNKFYI